MKYKLFSMMFALLCANTVLLSQNKVTVELNLLSQPKQLQEYIFQVKITNNDLPKYPLQDTAYIKSLVSSASRNFVVPEIEIKKNGKYQWVELYKMSGIPALDSCLDECCNCIFLKRGQSLRFQLKLLDCCDWIEGAFRVRVRILPPLKSINSEELAKEYYSNYVYFKSGR